MLRDFSGKSVRCVALGRNVDNPALHIGLEVVLFFTTALKGLGKKPGQMWVYDDSHIFSMRQLSLVPPARGEIYIS